MPAGGGEEVLLAACVELNGQPFDQAHPLWEIWLLTGALDGHVAMLIRFHHILADGLAALLLATSGQAHTIPPPLPNPNFAAQGNALR